MAFSIRRIGPFNRGPFEGPDHPDGISNPVPVFIGNANQPQDCDLGRLAGYAVIFATALASGSVDDSRLTWGSQQAQIYDQSATRSVFSSTRGATPQTGTYFSTLPQDEVQRTAQVWSSSTAALLKSIGAYVYVPPQVDERIQPAIVASVRASGQVDDSRLTWGSQQAQIFDQSATRSVWGPAVNPTIAYQPLRLIYAAPQLADLTIAPEVWSTPPPRQGSVPAPVFSPQQLYVDVPSFLLAPIALRQGPVPAPILIGQQAYTDVPLAVRAPPAMAQGRVPATMLVGQQFYTDLPSIVLSPTPAPQGRVPAMQWATGQVDPTQPVWVFASVRATVVLVNPVAPFFAVPAQIEGRQDSSIWPALRSGQTPTVPPSTIAPPQLDPTQLAAQYWRPTPSTQGRVPPLSKGQSQDDPTQLAPQVWVSLRAFVPIPNPVAPFFAVPEQIDVRPAPVVWSPAIASIQRIIPRISVGTQEGQLYDQNATRNIWPAVQTSQPLAFAPVVAQPQYYEPQQPYFAQSVFTPAAIQPQPFVTAVPQADPSMNYSAVFVMKTFVTPGGQPFRAWVGIGKSSSGSNESGNLG